MPTRPQRPNWSYRLPERNPGDLGPIEDEAGSVFACFVTAVRVEVDPQTEEVIEAIVDEGTMAQPSMITRLDGSIISGADHARLNAILSRAEWPTWDYGTARHGPVADSTRR